MLPIVHLHYFCEAQFHKLKSQPRTWVLIDQNFLPLINSLTLAWSNWTHFPEWLWDGGAINLALPCGGKRWVQMWVPSDLSAECPWPPSYMPVAACLVSDISRTSLEKCEVSLSMLDLHRITELEGTYKNVEPNPCQCRLVWPIPLAPLAIPGGIQKSPLWGSQAHCRAIQPQHPPWSNYLAATRPGLTQWPLLGSSQDIWGPQVAPLGWLISCRDTKPQTERGRFSPGWRHLDADLTSGRGGFLTIKVEKHCSIVLHLVWCHLQKGWASSLLLHSISL